MHAAADRLEFAPPPQPGMLRAFALAVAAHVLLVLALMHGLQWQRETQDAGVEAELWSKLPQEAAPPPVVAPPPPPPQPVVKAPPQPAPEPPVQRDADIALEKEKLKRELEKKKLAEERELQRRKELAAKKREEELAQKKREEDLAKKKLEQQKLAEAKRKEDEKKRKEQEAREERETQRVAKLREENLRRMQGLATGSGSQDAKGTAAQSSGPSASWGARVQARVRPNIVFSDDFSGNPEAVIEVRLAPDGTIVSKRVKKSSGNRGWDEAVIRALDKTEVLPRDVDGRVPSGGDLVFRPKG